MSITQRLWISAAAGVAAIGLVTGAEAYVTVGPNFCIDDGASRISTATTCYMQLDLFNVPEASNPNYEPEGYVHITVSLTDQDTMHFDVTSNTVDGVEYRFRDLWFNLLDPDVTLSGTSIFSSSTGSFNVDGWGTFNTALEYTETPPTPLTSASFDLNFGSSTYADLLTDQFLVLNGSGNNNNQNSGGQSAAGHVLEFVDGVNQDVTGFAAWPSCQDQGLDQCIIDTPEPGALGLFGLGLIGLGGLLLRRRAA